MKVLVIEDDTETARFIVGALREADHVATYRSDGREGLKTTLSEPWDLVIVDRMLPELDGIAVIESMRRGGSLASILMLTTLGGIDDRVLGLNAGADDYLVKPFAFAELLARVAALGRRGARSGVSTSIQYADLNLDLLARTASRGGEPIDLLPREFRLLEYLMKHAGQVVTRTMLLEHVWEVHFDPHTSVVETHMSRLRCKVDRGNSLALIHTVRGSGYTLRDTK